MHEIVTLGETMAVLWPTEPVRLTEATTLTLSIAGAESNLAIGLSQLGHQVCFLSRVGHDPFGQRICAALAAEGVDATHVLVDETAPTGLMFREWLADGKRRVWYTRTGSAASRLAPADLPANVFIGTRLLHVTGITPALSASCQATVTAAIDLAHRAGAMVSFDPNYRPALWDPATARQVLLPLMAQADILLVGHEDSQALLEAEEAASVFQKGREWGTQVVVWKEAERGASACVGETVVQIPADPVETIIDPVGAGDAFNAGFLSGWLRGETLETSLRLGARGGAAMVAILGDYISR